MTFRLSKNFHGVGIGPLSKILAVKELMHGIKPPITTKLVFPNFLHDFFSVGAVEKNLIINIS